MKEYGFVFSSCCVPCSRQCDRHIFGAKKQSCETSSHLKVSRAVHVFLLLSPRLSTTLAFVGLLAILPARVVPADTSTHRANPSLGILQQGFSSIPIVNDAWGSVSRALSYDKPEDKEQLLAPSLSSNGACRVTTACSIFVVCYARGQG